MLGVAVTAFLVAGLPVYVFPSQTRPVHADVMYVLGAPQVWRLKWADDLMRSGVADELLISVPPGSELPSTCSAKEPYPVLCITPEPVSTGGEALALNREMDSRGWTTAIVITSTPHVARAQATLDRCAGDGVSVVGRADGLGLGDWIWQYLYQTVAFAKLAVAPEC